MNRRGFLKSSALGSAITFAPLNLKSRSEPFSTSIACQHYTCYTYFKREGKVWMEKPAESFREFVRSGLTGYEPSFSHPKEVNPLKKDLDKLSLWTKSMYVNSVLHEPELVEKNIIEIIEIAKEAKKIGISILVTNPTPIKWGGLENKTDEQLKAQAIALNLLGKKLKTIGLTLAYHNHDVEMREGAREFHHMLTGTDPEYVKLCLDAHWIYRGSGNSQVALFDIVDIYLDRIAELHVRQSHNGTWCEVFEEGDIDYDRLASILAKNNMKPHIVLEQAIEEGTPHTIGAVEAMSKSLDNMLRIFNEII